MTFHGFSICAVAMKAFNTERQQVKHMEIQKDNNKRKKKGTLVKTEMTTKDQKDDHAL